MIKKINIEEIKKREEFLSGKLLTRKEVECALEEAKAYVKRNMEYLNGKFLLKADWKIILQSVPPASFQIQQVHTRKPFLNLEAAGRQTYTETDPC